MRLSSLLPPGPGGPPEDFYTNLALGDRAPAQRPYVVCNFVSSADGKATAGGRSSPLSGQADRRAFHLLRTEVDAVLAGTGTLETERYGAMIRDPQLVELRRRRGLADQPLAVIVSRSGLVPYDIPLFSASDSTVVLYGPADMVLPPQGAGRPTVVHHVLEREEGALAAALGSLRRRHGVRSLLCEGGPVLFDALLGGGLVDELFLTVSPVLVGGEERPVTAGPAPGAPTALRLVRTLEHEGHLLLRYLRVSSRAA